jgi:hypothetical protein
MTGGLVITEASVRRDGRLVARLRRTGREVTVLSADARPCRLGRILPAGYTEGDPGGSLFDTWTAKHPMVHTPSDTITARLLTFPEAVAFIIGGNSAAA